MCGQVTGAEWRNSDRVALGELADAGLIEWPVKRAARPALSDDAAYGLGLGAANQER